MSSNFGFPEELLSLSVEQVVAKCPNFKTTVENSKLTPFHLVIGLVPSGCPYDEFRAIRLEFLDSGHYLHKLPVFVILGDQSSSVDIKSFLRSIGFEAEKVDTLPADLTFKRYMDGYIGSGWDAQVMNHRIDLLHELVLISYVALVTRISDKAHGKILELYRECRGVTTEHIITDLRLNLKKMPKHIHDIQDFNVSGETIPDANGFRLPFIDRTHILRHLATEVGDRFSEQKNGFDITTGFQSMQVYAPIVHLTNVSGSGKTRAALELGKMTNVLHFKFAGSNGLQESEVGKQMIAFFSQNLAIKHRLDVSAAFHLVLQRILDICGEVVENHGAKFTGALIVDKIFGAYFKDHPELCGTPSPSFGEQIAGILFSGLDEIQVDQEICRSYDAGASFGFEPEVSEARILSKSNQKWLKNRRDELQKDFNVNDLSILKKLPNLLIVWDEAHALMSGFEDSPAISIISQEKIIEIDMYRLLRGTIRFHQFYWENCLCMTISTVAKALAFNPIPTEDPSYRPGVVIVMLNPIILQHTFDSYRSGTYKESSITDWKTFAFGWERVLQISYCGRPLWGAEYGTKLWKILETYQPEDRDKLKSFNFLQPSGISAAFYKLGAGLVFDIGGQFKDYSIILKPPAPASTTRQNPNTLEPEIGQVPVGFKRLEESPPMPAEKAVPILALSVALQKYPSDVDIAELVRVGPMALMDIERVDKTVEAIACSEGLFNGVASWMLLKYLEETGRWFSNWIKQNERCVISVGEIGEVIDRIAMLRAVSVAERSGAFKIMGRNESVKLRKQTLEFIYEPVSLEEFLAAYAGEEAAAAYLYAHPDLHGSFVAFSHFIYMGKDPLANHPYDVAANAFTRGAAVVPRLNTPGADALIPLVLKNGQMSFVYLQVKMGHSYKLFPTPAEVAQSSPQNGLKVCVGKDRNGEKLYKTTVKDRPYCYIYRQYNGDKEGCSYRVYPSRHGKIKHQPCLALNGAVENLGNEFANIAVHLCKDPDNTFLNKNPSLKNVWEDPSTANAVERKSFEDQFPQTALKESAGESPPTSRQQLEQEYASLKL